ncbi:hypothetical protein DFH29DRAFT_897135, partial [Suillus ampliporus]
PSLPSIMKAILLNVVIRGLGWTSLLSSTPWLAGSFLSLENKTILRPRLRCLHRYSWGSGRWSFAPDVDFRNPTSVLVTNT